MPNIIKKIKIKQDDGTFTNPIPIGTNSDYVNYNNNNLTEVLSNLLNGIDEIENENKILYSQIPSATVSGESITINDSAALPIENIKIKGNTSTLVYICDGTETGDYYFTYNEINYQFTMPTISEGSKLIFYTNHLTLFLGSTKITTINDNTGTLITLSPQKVTGTVTIVVSGKNILPQYNESTSTSRGVTFVREKNGSITINGTASGGQAVQYIKGGSAAMKLKAGRYFWAYGASKTLLGCRIGNDYNNHSSHKYIDITKDDTSVGEIYAAVNNETTVTDAILYPILTKSNTSVPYEPTNREQYTLNLGTIELESTDVIQLINNIWCLNTTAIENQTLIDQLNNVLNNMKTRYLTTVIDSFNTNDVDACIEITYKQDIKTIINS